MSTWEGNPYVAQVDRLVTSLEKLSHTFLGLDDKEENFVREEADDLYHHVSEKVCEHCHRKTECEKQDGFAVRQMLHEICCATEDYGAELNVELKRSIQSRCTHAPRFLRYAVDAYRELAKNRLFEKKMMQSREGCAVQMDSFAHVLRHATVELAASIFSDEHLEKKIKNRLARFGVRLLSSVFFVTKDGRYEIHVTARLLRGECVDTADVARIVSDCVARRMVPAKDESPVLRTEYRTLIFVEARKYYTMQGIARIGKGCEKISGDNYSTLEYENGKCCMILSDGMGSGTQACRDSTLAVEMLEDLLEAGFPKETALQMLNTMLVMGREEVRFSTIDMAVFDLYQGRCELMKAGAAVTFIKKADRVDMIRSESLPVGVVPKIEADQIDFEMDPGDIMVLVTDGVTDALPVGRQEEIMQTIIGGREETNLQEFARVVLEQVLVYSGSVPADDMTVLAVGLFAC